MTCFRPLIAFAAAVVVLASAPACSSNSDSAAQPTSTKLARPRGSGQSGTEPSPPPVHKGPIIAAFGDSLTAGVAGRSYPEHLQDLLDRNNLTFRVENQGVSGDTSADGLARIDNVIALHPMLVVLEFGGNDGLRGTPIESTRRNLETMIERFRDANIQVALLGITLPPNYGPEYVKPFTALFPQLARKYALPIFPFLLQNVYRNPALMQPDGIHPNGQGNRIIAQDVYALIAPLLQQEPRKSRQEPAGKSASAA